MLKCNKSQNISTIIFKYFDDAKKGDETMKKNDTFMTTRGERTSYGVYFFGQLVLFMLVTSFLQLFLTDMGVPALVVGGIFIAAKIWDAVNDPLFGVIVDKTHLKGGKYKPWVKLSTFLIPLTTLFMFALPSGASIQVKSIWAAFSYMLWDTAYTMCDVPIFAIATAMTNQVNERNTLYALNRFFCMLGGLAVSILVPMLYPRIGWLPAAAIMCLMALATMLPIGFVAKERVNVEEENSPTLKELANYLIKNKYLLVFNGAFILYAFTNTTSAVQNYFAINGLGGSEWITALALTMSLPMLAVALLVPKFIKRVDKFKLYMIAMGTTIVLSIIMFFLGYSNTVVFFVMAALRSVSNSMSGVILVMCTADCAEYGHFKSGRRAQGIAFSIQTFTAKISGAVASAVCMFILGLVGFKSGIDVVQSTQTVEVIWFLYSAAPAIAGSLSFVLLLLFYKLNDHDVQIMARCNQGEITREEAEGQLLRKY